MNMNKLTINEILMKIAEGKNTMEKSKDFAQKTMGAVRAKTSLDSFGVMQLSRDVVNLKASSGEARKSAAAGLAKSLSTPHKPVSKARFCGNCGNKLAAGAVFCPNCGAKLNAVSGTKTGALPNPHASKLSEFHF
jgi:membrane protease subunit (stomatin/prohibitin family)